MNEYILYGLIGFITQVAPYYKGPGDLPDVVEVSGLPIVCEKTACFIVNKDNKGFIYIDSRVLGHKRERALVHELTHYVQWINKLQFTRKHMECLEAEAEAVVLAYTQKRKLPRHFKCA